jgi:hypothetical protein
MSTPFAAEVCKHFELSDEARALLKPPLKPRPFLEVLIEKAMHDDAVMLMAHAMPKREAIWWACQCVRLAAGDALAPPASEPIAEAEAWAAQPTDEQRRKAFQMAEAASFDPPAGFVGMAVFFSSGSLSLPNLPPVPPKEHLSAGMVGNAVKIAAVSQGGAKAAEFYPQFFALGFDVAGGKNRWKEPA